MMIGAGGSPAADASIFDGGEQDAAAVAAPTPCHLRIQSGPTRLTESNAAVDEAIGMLTPLTKELSTLLITHYFHRRFDIDAFAEHLALYDATLALGTSRDGYYRVARRIADPENIYQPGDWGSIESPVDELTLSALYCGHQPLPADYDVRLTTARDAGGYELTHVGMALTFLEDNGCAEPLGPSFRADVEMRMASIPDSSDGLDDLEIEAIAFLLQMERGDLVRPQDMQLIVDSRLPSGGWPEYATDADSSWHATGLALWALLLYECPGLSEPFANQP